MCSYSFSSALFILSYHWVHYSLESSLADIIADRRDAWILVLVRLVIAQYHKLFVSEREAQTVYDLLLFHIQLFCYFCNSKSVPVQLLTLAYLCHSAVGNVDKSVVSLYISPHLSEDERIQICLELAYFGIKLLLTNTFYELQCTDLFQVLLYIFRQLQSASLGNIRNNVVNIVDILSV